MTKPSTSQIGQSQKDAVSHVETAQPESFSKRRTKSEFIDWIDVWFQSKAGLDSITSLLKRNPYDKRMYEEAAPVYHYVCRFYREQSDIQIELAGDSRTGDGKILDSDGSLIEHVEITMPFAPNDHSERHQLAAGLTLVDHYRSFETYTLDKSVGLIDQAISKKLGKPYPPQTVLLVVLPPGMATEDDGERFNQVMEKLRPIPSTSQFRRILVMECGGAFWGEPSRSSTEAEA